MPPIEISPWVACARSEGGDIVRHATCQPTKNSRAGHPGWAAMSEYLSRNIVLPRLSSLLLLLFSHTVVPSLLLVVSTPDAADITFRACSIFVEIVPDLV
jgi:hypothetical protein